jgi:hypothetical protein
LILAHHKEGEGMVSETLIIGLIALVVGALLCFAGYRLFRILIAVWGFFIGFLIGAQVIASLLHSDFLTTPLAWGAGLVLGLVLAVLAYALYAAAVTILGSSIGYLIGAGLATALGYGNQEFVVIGAGLALAIIFGTLIMAFDLVRLLVIANTALGGSGTVLTGVLLLFGIINLNFLRSGVIGAFIKNSPGWILLWLALAVIGGTFQMQNTQRYRLEKYTAQPRG